MKEQLIDTFKSFYDSGLPTRNRPDFGPEQIKNPEDLVIGEKYQRMSKHKLGNNTIFTLQTLPNDGKWINIQYETGYTTILSTSDFGVTPYEGGVWNSVNWLERAYPRNLEELRDRITKTFETAFIEIGNEMIGAGEHAYSVFEEKINECSQNLEKAKSI